jgi:YcaO-like protein with predicted kinase domain
MPYKTRPPDQTLTDVKSCLGSIGADTRLVGTDVCFGKLHSCRVELSDQPGIGTNGKGLSEAYSLASGYAEFIERLQTHRLFSGKISAQAEQELDRALADERLERSGQTIVERRVLAWEELDGRESLTRFWALPENRPIGLSFGSTTLKVQTNGLAAGNTYDEALAQAFCEILERDTVSRVFAGSLIPTRIDTDRDLMNSDLGLSRIVAVMEESGYHVSFYDCSDGSFNPTVMTCVRTPHRRFRVTFGTHPRIDHAIARCLTESFQGKDERTSRSQGFVFPTVPGAGRSRAIRIGGFCVRSPEVGQFFADYNFAIQLAVGLGTPPAQSLWGPEGSRNTAWSGWADLEHGCFNDEFIRLYAGRFGIAVKNMAVLGFPTTMVVIPGVSDVAIRSPTGRSSFSDAVRTIRPTSQIALEELLSRIKAGVRDTITTVLELVDAYSGTSRPPGIAKNGWLKHFDRGIECDEFSNERFAGLLCLQTNDYSAAADWFYRAYVMTADDDLALMASYAQARFSLPELAAASRVSELLSVSEESVFALLIGAADYLGQHVRWTKTDSMDDLASRFLSRASHDLPQSYDELHTC